MTPSALEEVPDLVGPLPAVDRTQFDVSVYTTLDQALTELRRRREDPELATAIREFLGNDIPEPLRDAPRAVLFRQLATPNYEARRFFSLVESIEELHPLFWEYYQDKFTSNNQSKHAWGKPCFYERRGKKGGTVSSTLTVIDFNAANGEKIDNVRTLWGESLIDFHHAYFNERFRDVSSLFYDASAWFKAHGSSAHNYYASFISLFIRDGVLFENFLLDETEIEFTQNIFLPAFDEVKQRFGLTPLIVALEPTDIEGDSFWMCYPNEDKEYVLGRMKDGGGSSMM